MFVNECICVTNTADDYILFAVSESLHTWYCIKFNLHTYILGTVYMYKLYLAYMVLKNFILVSVSFKLIPVSVLVPDDH